VKEPVWTQRVSRLDDDPQLSACSVSLPDLLEAGLATQLKAISVSLTALEELWRARLCDVAKLAGLQRSLINYLQCDRLLFQLARVGIQGWVEVSRSIRPLLLGTGRTDVRDRTLWVTPPTVLVSVE
jgi:hypothetical protein